MRNITLLSVLVEIISCKQVKERLNVTEIVDGMEVTRGYVVLATDSVFHVDQRKFIVKSREYFNDKGEVTHAVIRSTLGYSDWPKKAFAPIAHFLEDNQMQSTVKTYLMDSQRLVINADTALVRQIDIKVKVIYYNLKRDNYAQGPRYIHYISYR
jgi:hypothetical protein